MERIKVVLCTDGVFPHAMGGMQRHSRLLAEHLAATGRVDLTVLHPHDTVVFDPDLGIREIRVPPIDPHRTYLLELWRYSKHVDRELRKLEPQVILAQGFCVWRNIARYRDRLILHPHGLEMFQAIGSREKAVAVPFRLLLKYLARRSAVVISLGGRLTGILRNVVRGSRCRVVVVPNAVEVPHVMPVYACKKEPLRMLFVGRFAFNKGLDVLMEVARRLHGEGHTGTVRFELAGDGPLLAHYQGIGLPPNVVLLGRVDDARLFQLYQECDALVLPTRFEGMPTVVLEAMAHARPVLVSDVGATAELVDDRNGALLPKGDVEALYRAVLEFAQASEECRGSMARVSWERANSRFRWPVVVREILGLMEEMARVPGSADQRV